MAGIGKRVGKVLVGWDRRLGGGLVRGVQRSREGGALLECWHVAKHAGGRYNVC